MIKNMRNHHPPRLILWILNILKYWDTEFSLLGDCSEEYKEIVLQRGITRANLWMWGQVLGAIPVYIKFILASGGAKLNNYLRITFRNLRRYKIFSLINITGLAIGIACSILVLLYVTYELGYDQFHQNKDFIFRVTSRKIVRNDWYFSPYSPAPAGRVLKNRFPEVKDYTTFRGSRTPCIIKKGDELFRINDEVVVNRSFFKIFSFRFVHGDPRTALDDPSSVVVTESFARTWLETTDALGKTINVRGADRTVSGVLKDLPHNSHLKFGLVVPLQWHLDNEEWQREYYESIWKGYGVSTYLLMNQKIEINDFNEKIRNIVQEFDPQLSTKISLQPLNRVYLHSNFQMEEHEAEESRDLIRGNIHYLRLLSLAAACILLIACINFMNLSTAVSSRRAKEVGIRKVCGSRRKDLIIQFLGESISLAFISFFLALILVFSFLPVFNHYAGTRLDLKQLLGLKMIFGMLGIVLLTGIISGSYPALFLSSLRPVHAMKNPMTSERQSPWSLRKVLVVFQFALAITIIIGTTVFTRQFHFIQKKFSSFNLDNTIALIDWTFARHHEEVKQKLLQHPDIVTVSQSSAPAGAFNRSSDIHWPGKDPAVETFFFYAYIDHDYLELFKPQILKGRFFSKDISTDANNFIVNETAVKTMGMTDPLGKRLIFKGRRGRMVKEGAIIGVFKDRHFASLHYSIKPMLFQINHDFPRFNVKVNSPESIPLVLDYINQIRKQYPDYRPVFYRFIEEELSHYMKEEHRLSSIFYYVTFLTIFIACLGLLGLSLFHVAQKSKEIGIRKVFGCSVPGVVRYLIKEFIKWVLLANVISWPIAYILVNQWLQNYVYRVPVGLLTFILSGLIALIVATLTVAYQSIKTAQANPVESLRYE